MTKSLKFLFGFQIFVVVLLSLYSFTQVDLGLTLSQVSIWQEIQKPFRYIGFFNRPLSSILFVSILISLFISYLGILYLSYTNKISRKTFWRLLLVTSGILTLSYSAFSYDLFNYIFDAKIVTHYGQNPYIHKALDFPNDPMLSFMRWTHRLYPYGPAWLGITIPLSFAGLNIFLLTFFIFKMALAMFFLGSIYILEKILETKESANKIFALSLFAFNPLVLIESLVSSHNDIVMMFFALLGVYLFLKRKILFSILFVIASYLIKSVTIFLLIPIFISTLAPFVKRQIKEESFSRLCLLSVFVGFLYVLTKFEIQSWYFLWILPFISMLRPNKFLISASIFFSFGLLLTYIVAISQGNYDNIVYYKRIILSISLLASFLAQFIFSRFVKSKLEL